MLFSSHLFLFYFLPCALLVYYVVPGRLRHLVLTLLSYVFYGWANPIFVVLMLASTAIDYACGRAIAGERLRTGERLEEGGPRTHGQRTALVVSIVSNLTLLGVFKYFNFGVESYNACVTALGFDAASWETMLRITLPLGISFYTFQSMSYTIDVYRGHAAALANPIDFSCYVSMFPQLVAGPIIRFSEVADQLRSRTHTYEKFARGVAMFAVGMAKKVVLANACGRVADVVFDAGTATVFDAWYGVTAYAFQIYFDFSAYSDMAIGLGLMLGFVFPKNFDSPYRSQSITEFWQRWHISLSSWLRDYLYIPLGGNRNGAGRTYVNLALVMLLGGLWHGASWNFVIWGAIHGGWLAFERAQGKDSAYRTLPAAARTVITFGIVLVAWVFFRAETLPQALTYLGCMFGAVDVQPGAFLTHATMYAQYSITAMVTCAFVIWVMPQTWDWTRELSGRKAVLAIALLVVSAVLLETQSYNPFIYFIF
jgi:alginate O-acetyltransferase complex protein AlgI